VAIVYLEELAILTMVSCNQQSCRVLLGIDLEYCLKTKGKKLRMISQGGIKGEEHTKTT